MSNRCEHPTCKKWAVPDERFCKQHAKGGEPPLSIVEVDDVVINKVAVSSNSNSNAEKPIDTCTKGHTLVPSTSLTEKGYVTGGSCDVCRNRFPYGTARWHCISCAYDVCFSCRPHDVPDIFSEVKCSEGHYLQLNIADKTSSTSWTCSGVDVFSDGCKLTKKERKNHFPPNLPPNTQRWQCRTCDFDYCTQCMSSFTKPYESHSVTVTSATPLPSGNSDDPESGLIKNGDNSSPSQSSQAIGQDPNVIYLPTALCCCDDNEDDVRCMSFNKPEGRFYGCQSPKWVPLFNEEETCCSILTYDTFRLKEVSDVTCYPKEYNDWCYKPDKGDGGGFCKEEDMNNPFKFCLKMVCVVITLPFYIGKILFYDCLCYDGLVVALRSLGFAFAYVCYYIFNIFSFFYVYLNNWLFYPLGKYVLCPLARLFFNLVYLTAYYMLYVVEFTRVALLHILYVPTAILGFTIVVLIEGVKNMRGCCEKIGEIVRKIADCITSVVKAICDAICAILTWIYVNIIKPVIDFIIAVWMFIYTNICAPIYSAIVFICTKIYEGIRCLCSFLCDNILRPVYDFISCLCNLFYEKILLPIWQFCAWVCSMFYEWVILPLYTGVKMLFTAIYDLFNWVYQNIILPIARAIRDLLVGIGNAIGSIFS